MPCPQFSRRAWMGVGLATAWATRAWTIDPIPRDMPPAFRLSLAAYSYRKLLTGSPAQLSLFDFVDDCAEMDLEGTELTSYYFPQPCPEGFLRDLKRHCFRRGVEVSGTAIRCDFGVPPGERRQREIDHVRSWIDRAETLGAPIIRIFAGHQASSQNADDTHRWIVEGIQECCNYAGSRGVHLALENHGGPTATAEGLLRIVRDVESDWFGVNLDTGNFHSKDIYEEIEEAAPYVLNVQVKVATSGPDKRKQPTDLSRIAAILREVQYRGYVVLEYEEEGDPREESRRYVREMKKVFRQRT